MEGVRGDKMDPGRGDFFSVVQRYRWLSSFGVIASSEKDESVLIDVLLKGGMSAVAVPGHK